MEILDFIMKGGLGAVGALASYLGFQYFRNKINLEKVADPINHPFFSAIIFERDVKLPNIKINYHNHFCPVRTLLFQDMLRIKYTNWHDTTKEFASCKNYDNVTKATLSKIVQDSILSFVKDYSAQWRREGIPEIVISKFSEWHEKHTTMLINATHDICMGEYFSSNKEKYNAVLELHKAMIILTVIDVEATLGHLNGELSGLEYKGKIIE